MTVGHFSKNVMTLLFLKIHLIYSVVLVSGDDTFFLVVLTLSEILGPVSVYNKQWYQHFRRRQWHPTPVLLPGKSHGRRSLVGCSPWGC